MDTTDPDKGFVVLHLSQELLRTHDLPDIAYPVRQHDFEDAIRGGNRLPLAAMLFGLQEQSRKGDADLDALNPAMLRLADMLTRNGTPQVVTTASGDDWWLEIGPVPVNDPLITIQRRGKLVAAIAKRNDGRLRVSTYSPLDGKSAASLIGLGHNPHPTGGVCLRENNWEYALDCSATTGNVYAEARGEAYLSYWKLGLGTSEDQTAILAWRSQGATIPRPTLAVVAELGVQDRFRSVD